MFFQVGGLGVCHPLLNDMQPTHHLTNQTHKWPMIVHRHSIVKSMATLVFKKQHTRVAGGNTTEIEPGTRATR